MEDPNISINNCLTNCSNQGFCYLGISGLFCNCNQYYAGQMCQINIRPCSYFPCLNSGTCIQNLENMTYTCNCSQHYYGSNCQSKNNVCANETCSNHGICKDINSVPTCKCFYLYNGTHCELESAELATRKTVISVATIIAIFVLALTLFWVVLMDIHKLFIFLFKKAPPRKPKPLKIKYKYINALGLHSRVVPIRGKGILF